MTDLVHRLGYRWTTSFDPKAVFLIEKGLQIDAPKEEIMEAIKAQKDMNREYYAEYCALKLKHMGSLGTTLPLEEVFRSFPEDTQMEEK